MRTDLVHFILARYTAGLSAILMAGLVCAVLLRKSNPRLAAVAGAAAICVSSYGFLLIDSNFTFFGRAANRGPERGGRVVALTFDDGPSVKYTQPILDILKRHGAHATFFVLGANARRHPELIRRMAREGHELGNHGMNHYFFLTLTSAARKREIIETQRIVKTITGRNMKYFRAPYEYKDLRLLWLLRRLGYRYIGHNTGSGDASGSPAAQISANVAHGLRPGSIVLLHDARGHRRETVRALDAILTNLEKKGYRAVTISELLAR